MYNIDPHFSRTSAQNQLLFLSFCAFLTHCILQTTTMLLAESKSKEQTRSGACIPFLDNSVFGVERAESGLVFHLASAFYRLQYISHCRQIPNQFAGPDKQEVLSFLGSLQIVYRPFIISMIRRCLAGARFRVSDIFYKVSLPDRNLLCCLVIRKTLCYSDHIT